MGARSGEVQLQAMVPPAVLRELRKAAIDLQEYIPRHRVMDRGPMVGYLCRWFLSLDEEARLRIILAGKRIADGLPPEAESAVVTVVGVAPVEAGGPVEVEASGGEPSRPKSTRKAKGKAKGA